MLWQVSRGADLCQRNCGDTATNNVLWFRLLDVLLKWQRNTGPAAHGGRLGPRLRQLVRMVLGRISDQIPLDVVLEHILDQHTSDALGADSPPCAPPDATRPHGCGDT